MNGLLAVDPAALTKETYVARRVGLAPLADREALQTALSYLYMDDGPVNLPRDRLKVAKAYLGDAERVVVQWLQTRTNGSERKNYGKDALISARRSRYRCDCCGFADVRTLNLDHVEGRVLNASFAYLCANCHTVKSREKDRRGAAKETWYHGTASGPFERFNTSEAFLTPCRRCRGLCGERWFNSTARDPER
jgi:hypothetical protein